MTPNNSDFNADFENMMAAIHPVLHKIDRDIPVKVRSLGRHIARYSRETSLAMVENSPGIITRVGYDGLEQITALGLHMAQNCRFAAAAVFKGSAGLIDGLAAFGNRNLALRVYALSDRVCATSWKAAARMLEDSPRIIRRIGYEGLKTISEISMRIAPYCWLTAVSNFEKSPLLIDRLREFASKESVMDVFHMAAGVSRTSWQMAVCLLENSPSLIDRIGHGGLTAVAGFGGKIAPHSWLSAVEIIEKSPHYIDDILSRGDASLVMDVFNCCSRAADQCWRIAVVLFDNSPSLIRRMGYAGFETMAAEVCGLAKTHYERAESFIKGESGEGAAFMDKVAQGMELAKIKPVLANYINALLSYRVEIAPGSGHGTDGRRIFLPESIDDFGDKQKNFMVYKVFATHEEAHLEYGSFDFSLSRIPDVIGKIKARYNRNP